MATGRRQKGYKRVLPGEIERRIVGVELKDPLAPTDKVKMAAVRTVAKPNCDQIIQAKKVTLNVKAPKASVRKKQYFANQEMERKASISISKKSRRNHEF